MPSEANGEPVWPPLDTLVAINIQETRATGEPHAIPDRGLLKSAWAKPQNRWAWRDFADAFVQRIAHGMDEPAFAELLRPHVVEHG